MDVAPTTPSPQKSGAKEITHTLWKQLIMRWAIWLGISIVSVGIIWVVLWCMGGRASVIEIPNQERSISILDPNFSDTIKNILEERIKNGIFLSIKSQNIVLPAEWNGKIIFTYRIQDEVTRLQKEGIAHFPHLPKLDTRFPYQPIVDTEALNEWLIAQEKDFFLPARPAGLVWNNGNIRLREEIPTQYLDKEKSILLITSMLRAAITHAIPLPVIADQVQITATELKNFWEQNPGARDIFPITLRRNSDKDINSSVKISPELWYENIFVKKDENNTIKWALRESFFEDLIQNPQIQEYESEPVPGELLIDENGKATRFTPTKDGISFDIDAMHDALITAWLTGNNTVDIIWKKIPAQGDENSAVQYGIRELIGVGRSSYAGSPANRRHNIALGVAAVNGTMIPPGGEFSLLEVLGKIDGSTGYLPELVIKGDHTVPEYGGGLCQIGTTAFRAALNTGLPITARRNHSFVVRYYEPIGTDATIYNPSPDFKFRNDTAHWIVFRAYSTKSSELVFELWGTRDGREATYPAVPRTFNRVPAPPTKVIPSSELKPGERRCTETARDGIDASFDYIVKMSDGTERKQTFFSRYRPWQAVCLIGMEKQKKEKVTQDEKGAEAPPIPLSSDLLAPTDILIPPQGSSRPGLN